MSLFKTIYTLLLLIVLSLSFSACSDDSSDYVESATVPSIAPFIAHIDIDTNTTVSSVLGRIETISSGSSNIIGYTLEGIGKSNFTIDRYGELSILNYASSLKYDLKVVARNSFGDSTEQEVIVEVTSLDQPVLLDKIVNTDNSIIDGLLDTFTLLRDGNSSTDFINIKDIEIVGEYNEAISITNDGSINATGVNGGLQVGRHYFKVRPINENGIIGPYTSLIINVDEYNYDYYYDDDFPDDLASAYNTFNVGGANTYGTISGYMNHDHDHDYIGFYLDENGSITIDLTTNIDYSYQNSGDYIALYDEFGTNYGTYSYNFPSIYLPPGQYYINVHETSDYYTVEVYFNY